jgi:hypothetical protein
MLETAALPSGATDAEPPLGHAFRELATSFHHAAAVAGLVERRLRIAGEPVLLRFATEELSEQLGRAFDHLSNAGDEEPVLTLHAWDAEQSGTAAPPLPPAEEGHPRGSTVFSDDGARRLAFRPALGRLSAFDGESKTGWFWCRSGEELPFWERAVPFHQVLHWWLPTRGKLLVHAAAVGRTSGGLLLVGSGGSGKSTCALSSLESTLLYAGDDYVAVDPGPTPHVFGLYCSGKLEPTHVQALPHLPPPTFAAEGTSEEKTVFYVSDRFGERMCEGFPLAAIVAPRVNGAGPEFAPLGAAEALAALAPSTLFQLVPADRQALTTMAGLLRRVPAYRLDVGGPSELLPGALERLLDEVRR